MEISDHDEPILLIESARHGLVSDEFVRNTTPDLISAEQDGLPVVLRDADLFVELADGMPDGTAMILGTDRRLGFDPSRDWVLKVLAVREHGMFQPEIGSVALSVLDTTPERFFTRPVQVKPAPPWIEALRNRQNDVVVLSLFLGGLVFALSFRMNAFAAQPLFTLLRLGILAVVVGFIGW